MIKEAIAPIARSTSNALHLRVQVANLFSENIATLRYGLREPFCRIRHHFVGSLEMKLQIAVSSPLYSFANEHCLRRTSAPNSSELSVAVTETYINFCTATIRNPKYPTGPAEGLPRGHAQCYRSKFDDHHSAPKGLQDAKIKRQGLTARTVNLPNVGPMKHKHQGSKAFGNQPAKGYR